MSGWSTCDQGQSSVSMRRIDGSMAARGFRRRADPILKALFAVFLMTPLGNAAAADEYKLLSGEDIKARFTDVIFTDEADFADTFKRDGTLASASVGVHRTGTWRVADNRLCETIAGGETCYQIWVSGDHVQFRENGLGVMYEGILKPRPQNK